MLVAKQKITAILLAAVLFACMGCGAEEEGPAVESLPDVPEESAEAQETTTQEKKKEQADSFRIIYQGEESNNDIELSHCDCVYDADDVQVFAEYLYWPMVEDPFPYNQYVLYIWTPQEEFQLYPVKDFLIDEEQGILYTKIAANDGFECVRSMSLTEKSTPMPDFEKEIFNAEEAEEMLRSAYDGQALFSNITVELTEIDTDGSGLLKGEIGGIEKTTGKRYYANWEIDMADGTRLVELCVLKQYDPVKDKEAFEECNKIFDQVEIGDRSVIKPYKEEYLWGLGADIWIRMDVNGDGMPELVGGWTIEELPDYEDSRKIEISVIYAYQDGMAEMVYVDVNDGMEFLFITAKGGLVYEWGTSLPFTNIFRRCTFDLKWNKEYSDTLVRYNFPENDEDDYKYFQEYYPDTYGVGGAGIYCLLDRPKTEEELKQNEDDKYTVRENITEEEFLKLYEEMTGWDFYKAQDMY